MLAAGSRIATDRASGVGQVKGDDPDRKGCPGPPGWGLGREANNLTSVKKTSLSRSLIIEARGIILVKHKGKFVRIKVSVLLLAMYSV